MDVQKLINLKYWLDYSSFTLSLESYVLLTNSLLLLQSKNHFKKILFWGIIQGLEADYFISFGYERDALTERKYFYSNDCHDWKLLPVPKREHVVLTELCKRPFQGDPGLIVEVVDDAPPEDLFPDQNTVLEVTEESTSELQNGENFVEEENVDNEERPSMSEVKQDLDELPPITSGELKEEDRLAAIVYIIGEEAATVPRGGIFKQTDGVSVHSRAFEGMKLDDADSLSSFQHYRVPRNDYNTNLLVRCDYNYAIDFLDPIDKDVPSDSWSAQLVEGERTIILRNLHWPGFTFFHYLDSPDHGYIYVGSGNRNLDIPFMTQVTLPNEPEIPAEISTDVPEGEEIPTEELDGPRGTRASETRPSKLSDQRTKSTRLSTKLSRKMENEDGSFQETITEEG